MSQFLTHNDFFYMMIRKCKEYLCVNLDTSVYYLLCKLIRSTPVSRYFLKNHQGIRNLTRVMFSVKNDIFHPESKLTRSEWKIVIYP
jgi:hypothetical protein